MPDKPHGYWLSERGPESGISNWRIQTASLPIFCAYAKIILRLRNGSDVLEKQWSLESLGADGAHVDFLITQLPCRIGRSKENDLVIANLGLSRFHAVLARDISGQIRVTDENSTNGTFVNRHRIEGYCLLNENDIIHFASAEFKLRMRMVEQRSVLSFDEMHTLIIPEDMALSEHFVPNESEFDELILGHGLSGAAQPIVDARTRQIVGYELLGRANHPQLPSMPIELFGLAESMGRELDLSSAFRNFGISNIAPRYAGHTLFINAHPKETFNEAFLVSLKRLRLSSPELSIVVEIHESAVTNTDKLRELANRLAQLGIRFAYDDFGSGQARLLELADVPPHFVKFDMSLIRGLHKASERKRQIVRDLVQMVLTTGSVPLAEGVEDEEEAKICIEMGFQLIQGFLTGKPISAD
jgi:EAL domain-containing protein (putative c-di-GMP-specific phosphodiesterase class I)